MMSSGLSGKLSCTWIGLVIVISLSFSELPEIDAVVISHNHYDHLDYNSVKKLNKRFGSKLRWYVAQGQAQWMRNNGCDNVVELSWWDEFRHEKNGKEFVFACTPSQHSSQRTLTDSKKVDLIE